MKKLPIFTAAFAACALASPLAFGDAAAGTNDITHASPYYWQDNIFGSGSEVSLNMDDVGGPQNTTESGINHLPVFHGHIETNRTYRFANVAEQILTIIGDGKHGLWRTQDDGRIRLYITKDADSANGDGGIAAPQHFIDDQNLVNDPLQMDEFVDDLTPDEIAILATDYSSFDDEAGFGSPGNGGYKAVTGSFNGQLAVNATGKMGWIDVPISHPVFGGKYDDHAPIDLPAWWCTMSYASHPNARALFDFVYAQSAAGHGVGLNADGLGGIGSVHDNVGPLGIRAGLDIPENYHKLIRLDLMGDANLWINTLKTADAGTDDVYYRQVDRKKTKAEIYFVSRAFFNEDYLFVFVVVDDAPIQRDSHDYDKVKHVASQFSYIRPEGPYFDHLVERAHTDRSVRRVLRSATKKFDHFPRFNVLEHKYNHDGSVKLVKNDDYLGTPKTRKRKGSASGMRLYGIHHPGDALNPYGGSSASGGRGGCPSMGGDFGENYFGNSFPTAYREVTPLCDALVIDIKFYANLDNQSWNRENKNMPNAAGSTALSADGLSKDYSIIAGNYGSFRNSDNPELDPYMERNGMDNPDEYTTGPGSINFNDVDWYVDSLGYPFVVDQVVCDVDLNGVDHCPNSPKSP